MFFTKYDFLWLVCFRVLNSLVVRAYFSPDEYWQSLEVAHKLVFGYGELTWEWESSALRSILHPGFFALLYSSLSVLGLDTPWLIAYSPRIVQGLLLCITEYFIFKSCGKNSLYFSAGSWFLWYAGVRTYSNSFELLFNAIALYLQMSNSLGLWSLTIGISCMIRPTAVMIWIPSFCYYFYTRGPRFIFTTAITA